MQETIFRVHLFCSMSNPLQTKSVVCDKVLDRNLSIKILYIIKYRKHAREKVKYTQYIENTRQDTNTYWQIIVYKNIDKIFSLFYNFHREIIINCPKQVEICCGNNLWYVVFFFFRRTTYGILLFTRDHFVVIHAARVE